MNWTLDWDLFRAEIDAGRPLVFLVDTNGDGSTDHFVTVVGYDVVGETPMYACLNTWDDGIHWWEFAPIAEGQPWGVSGATTFQLLVAPSAVTLAGPTTGLIETPHTFTATVQPPTATLPITYHWQIDGQPPIQQRGRTSDTVSLAWDTPGPKEITVTAWNAVDAVSDTHTITIAEPLAADFAAWPLEGLPPLVVTFTNQSSGIYTDSLWTFGDGLTSTQESPTHTYAFLGIYSVTLTISGLTGTDALTRPNYIAVTPVLAEFTASPTSGYVPLTVTFTNSSLGSYLYSLWDFGDGLSSTLPSPSHTYTAMGVYTVSLTVSGTSGSNLETKARYIAVHGPYSVYLPMLLRTH